MIKKTRKLQSLVDSQVGKGGLHNIVVAVQSCDQSLDFVGAAGVADADNGTAMTPETPYNIASITKMYTAAIIMQLYQEKRLDLDAPVSRYLPDSLLNGIHVYKGIDYSFQLKVYQLVNQTSGLADFETDKVRGGKSVLCELMAGLDRAIDTAEALRITRSLHPHFVPGTPGRAYYSNLNYRLLGEIIEAITEKPMSVNFEERICRPLGLQDTYLFDWERPRSGKSPAIIYLNNSPVNVPKYLSSNVSDGGLVSTAPECMIFLRAFFEGRLFDVAFLERMMIWNRIFFPLRYGYGLMYFKLPRYFWITQLPEFTGHSGSTGSFAFVCPSRSLYLTGTLNVITPARPFLFMMNLVRTIC
ncbi:MAG: beta-lactamase family protein [Spirochaetes bacterium]|nr:beta-lactamase family protein [Spirochaetota bacterium]MBN2772564.1 beta-lactamase family protein [Spirochaetota bacterium]